MAHAGGRPLKFATVAELKEKIDAYFASCIPHPEEVVVYKWIQKDEEYTDSKGKTRTRQVDDRTQPPTTEIIYHLSEAKRPSITGLALVLDTNRQTLLEYQGEVPGREKKDSEFADTIKRAKMIIEDAVQEGLNSSAPTGTIFNLKNNFEWKDKTESELTNPDGSLNPFNALTPTELRKLTKKK